MSTFACPVVELVIKPHPNADSIEIAEVGMFQSIVKKGEFKTGDKAIYIPEGAICPEEVMKTCHAWNEQRGHGKLNGSQYNRVKPVRLRGVMSEGLIHPMEVYLELGLALGEIPWPYLGVDVAEMMGITKYKPPIPGHLMGPNQPRIAGQLFGYTPNFDVENLKHNKNVFVDGEQVVVTEKLHGTCCIIGCFFPGIIDELGIGINKENLYKDQIYVGTKRLTKRGIVFDPNDLTTMYAKINNENGLFEKLLEYSKELAWVYEEDPMETASIVLLGEIFGEGVQDLGYGLSPEFRLFDIWYSNKDKPSLFHKCTNTAIGNVANLLKMDMAPMLYTGPYSESLLDYKEGKSFLCPSQIREGIVIRSEDGSKLYKLVSDAYLDRKNGTDYE